MVFALRKQGDVDNPLLPVPYGQQITQGKLVWYDRGGANGNQSKFICILGQGEMSGVDRVYYGGDVISEFNGSGQRQWHFHPGTLSTGFSDPVQGRPFFFPELNFTFSGMAYIEVMLPVERSNDEGDEPSKMFFFVRGRKVQDYTLDGSNNLVPSGAPIYSANNALVAADIITSFAKLPLTRIDGPSLIAFRDRCAQTIGWQASGTGFDAQYYSDTNLTTPVLNRTDDRVDFSFDWVAPFPVANNAFSARWTADIVPQYSQNYTFYVTYDDGVRLWVNGVQLVNDWAEGGSRTSSGIIALTAGTPYSLVLEYFQAGGPGNVKLEWESSSQVRQVIPKSAANAAERNIPRFEAHVAFSQEIDAMSALNAVMFKAPGCHWQDVNGKIKFITVPEYTDITGGAPLPPGGRALAYNLVYDPTQTVKKANIVENSFSAYRKSVFDKPNYLRASIRDLNNEFYDEAYPTPANRQALRDQAKALIDPGIMQLGVMTQSQGDRILESQMRLTSDLDLFVTVKGQAGAFHLAKGDVVRLSHDVPGWRETEPPLFMVTEEVFEPTVGDSGTADERSFVLQLYHPEFYSDTAHGPISGAVVSSITSSFYAPPVAESLTLTLDHRALHNGMVSTGVQGLVQFAPHPYSQVGEVWHKRPGASDYVYSNIRLTPDPVLNQAGFFIDFLEPGVHFIRVVTTTPSGVALQPITIHVTDSIDATVPALANPSNITGLFDAGDGDLSLEWDGDPDLVVGATVKFEVEIRNAADTATLRTHTVIPTAEISDHITWTILRDTLGDVTLLGEGSFENDGGSPVDLYAESGADPKEGLIFQVEVPPNGILPSHISVYPANRLPLSSGDLDGALLWERDFTNTDEYIPEDSTTHMVKVTQGDSLSIVIRNNGVAEFHKNYVSGLSDPVYVSKKRVQLDQRYYTYVLELDGEICGVKHARWIRGGNEFTYYAQMQRGDFGLGPTDPLPAFINVRIRQLTPYIGGAHSGYTSATFVR